MKLYAWTGFIPLTTGSALGITEDHPRWHVRQTSHWVVMPSDKAWRERFKYGYTHFKNYVTVHQVEREHTNPGAQLAIANPGTTFIQDIWNHTPGEHVYVAMDREE